MPPPLAPLFPDGVLRRGTTTTVSGPPGHGATTLALSLLAAASTAGSWCAAVGLPDPGVVAAAGLGLDLRRVVFVPHPGTGWAEAAGDLLSGVDAVLVRPPGRARLTAARHLSARARERQVALVVLLERAGAWPEGGDLALAVGAGAGLASDRAMATCAAAGPRCASTDAAPPAESPSARCGSLPARVRWRWRRRDEENEEADEADKEERAWPGGPGPGNGPEAA